MLLSASASEKTLSSSSRATNGYGFSTLRAYG